MYLCFFLKLKEQICEKAEKTGIKKKINNPLIVINWCVINKNKVPNNKIKIKLSFSKTDEKSLQKFLISKNIGTDKAM